jgi:hypothetical protein
MFKSSCENFSKRVKKKKQHDQPKMVQQTILEMDVNVYVFGVCRIINNGEGLLSVEQKVLFTGLRPSTFAQPF